MLPSEPHCGARRGIRYRSAQVARLPPDFLKYMNAVQWSDIAMLIVSIALEAANPAYETRIFGPDRVRVQGRLVGLIRRY